MTLRVGIVGCGLIAGGPVQAGRPIIGTHAAACREVEGISLVAVADPNPARLAAFGSYWGVSRLHSTAQAMFSAERPDIVIVATPPETHEEICLGALEHGVGGLLCEKPFTGTSAGARRIVEGCRRAGCRLVVNFSRRWDESHQKLARRLHAGEMGAVEKVVGFYSGTMRGNGTHFVDTLQMLVPGDWSVAWTSALGPFADDGPIEAVLTNGAATHAFIAPIRDAEYFVFEIHVLATKGRARIMLQGNDLRLDFPRPHEGFPGYQYLQEIERFPELTMPHATARALRALAEAMAEQRDPEVAADVHVTSLALVDAILTNATQAEKSR